MAAIIVCNPFVESGEILVECPWRFSSHQPLQSRCWTNLISHLISLAFPQSNLPCKANIKFPYSLNLSYLLFDPRRPLLGTRVEPRRHQQ